MEISTIGVGASLMAGGATFVGALPVLFFHKMSDRAITIMLGFGGGVMLAATAFSLLIPGIEAANRLYGEKSLVLAVITLGLMFGSLLLSQIHRFAPHEHFIKGVDGTKNSGLKRVWLFVIAIALHNFPEGLAVGVSFGSENTSDGIITALGIGLQNMPEGLIVAVSLIAEGYRTRYALWVSFLTAVIEPLGSFVGFGLVSLAQMALPLALAFAAGAMLFVICDDIIPESHQRGTENEGTIGIIAGFIVMVMLDIAFGS
jgi:zinc transporter, ZIP family